MSTIPQQSRSTIAPLIKGDRLDAATFQERYEAMPPGTRAELIGGVVVMSSPVGSRHGTFVLRLATWVGNYTEGVPGLYSGCEATTILDDAAVPQPDIQLHILPEYGGQTRIAPTGYIAGAPELVIEVSQSSKKTDLGLKRKDFERAGVLEYLVVTLDPDAVHWFVRREGLFVPMPHNAEGVFRSACFPGLWLDAEALFEGDLARLRATLNRGRATPEHAAFVAELRARRPS